MDCRTVRVTSASEGRVRVRVLNFYGRQHELKQWCAEIDSALEEVAVDDAV